MADPDTKVLLGDSTPSTFPPNVLDIIVELIRCVREIGTSYVSVTENLRLLGKLDRTTQEVVAELERFRHQAEIGVRATAHESSRPEVVQHSEEVVAQTNRMVEGWKQRYASQLETEQQKGAARREQLQRSMHDAVDAFLSPMRADTQQWWQRRILADTGYEDTIVTEPIPGLRITLRAKDPEPEIPRRLRTLLGKGVRVQVGIKKSRLRRTEEPAWLSLDDLVILESDTSPTRARLTLAKKAGVKDAVQLEIVMTDAGPSGSATLAVGTTAALPGSDRTTMTMVYNALQEENARLFAAPARLVSIALDGDEVTEANGMLAVAERLVEHHRPIIADIADHSPNVDELTIKVERDGKREETWIRRDELADHLLSLPAAVRGRLAIAELGVSPPVADGSDAALPLADLLEPEEDDEDGDASFSLPTSLPNLPSSGPSSEPSGGPELVPRELPRPGGGRGLPRPAGLQARTRPQLGAPRGAPVREITQDISLDEVELEVETDDEDDAAPEAEAEPDRGDADATLAALDEMDIDEAFDSSDDETDDLATKTRVRS